MRVFYKCACMPDEVSLEAPERGPDEEVTVWMRRLTESLTEDHRRRSPTCQESSTEYVKIPLPKSDHQPLGTTVQ